MKKVTKYNMEKKITDSKKENKIIYFVYLNILLLIFSLGGVFSKLASDKRFLSFEFCLYYGLVILNMLVYAIVWQQLLKHLPLTTAFCNKAVTIIWGMLWGVIFFQEHITLPMIIGAMIVFVGVCLVVTSNE